MAWDEVPKSDVAALEALVTFFHQDAAGTGVVAGYKLVRVDVIGCPPLPRLNPLNNPAAL